ncbi:tol-pal system protein YbgF [Hydrogenophilus thiooxidans]|uniref:tol-pal system protein YbgF n=1 Tax=Hydrogenophilus thiooxidans TaxID=2820326 RepID=UPI001C22B745|nr:tol-pal system protein YbgF [Hydrogenophilus thiooxidans]
MSAKRWGMVIALSLANLSPAWALFGDDAKRLEALQGQVQAFEERVNRLALDAANRENARQQELARLQGAIEELRYRLEQLEKRQKDFYLDLDQRLRAVSAAGSASAGTPPLSAAPGSEMGGAAGGSTGAPAATAAAASPAPASPTSAASATANAPQSGRAEAAALFGQALRELQAQKTDAALKDFETFLARYPSDPQAVEAHFWAGTAALQHKQYEKARQHFARVVFDHPGHELVPDAMLGLANALQGLGDRKEATDMLRRLTERYPNTPAGKIARERLGR